MELTMIERWSLQVAPVVDGNGGGIDYEMWTAIGTVAAVVVALGVAVAQLTVGIFLSIRRRRLSRRKVASLISAWLEHVYTSSPSGEYYRRSVVLHVANEADEPVFKVEALCGVESRGGTIQLGPLAAPRSIPVLPPKREFTYDVTMGFLGFGDYAHESFRGLVAKVEFRDHEGRRWERGFDGRLVKVGRRRARVAPVEASDAALAQAGPSDNPYNPMGTIFSFVQLANEADLSDSEFRSKLVEEAGGWSKASAGELSAFRVMLREWNVASHVWYPTPRVAYVRMLDRLPGQKGEMKMEVLTLVWRNGRGWILFGVGPCLPWNLRFDPRELAVDPLDGRA
ncbi:hypothetical protein ACTVCO_07695 [Sanguibacter sp. A247]|uniref:hypothetical protein n=1 Tax=unclassified Sanguibacter TaxID=2645534 RepID=UPI003FD7CDF0